MSTVTVLGDYNGDVFGTTIFMTLWMSKLIDVDIGSVSVVVDHGSHGGVVAGGPEVGLV